MATKIELQYFKGSTYIVTEVIIRKSPIDRFRNTDECHVYTRVTFHVLLRTPGWMRPQYTFKAPPAPKKAAKYTRRIESCRNICLFDVCVTTFGLASKCSHRALCNEDVQTYPLPSCSPIIHITMKHILILVKSIHLGFVENWSILRRFLLYTIWT